MGTRIKTYLGILVGVVAVVTGSITIWEFIKPENMLEVIVYTTEAEFPYSVAMDIKKLPQLPLEEIKKDDKLKSLKTIKFEDIERVQPVFQEYLTKKVDRILDDSIMGLPKSFTKAVLRNTGNKTLHDVEIKGSVGGNNVAQIQRDGGKIEIQAFSNKIKLGSVSPLSEIKIFIWSNHFSLFDSPLSLISHRDGVGEIIFYPPAIPLAIQRNTKSH